MSFPATLTVLDPLDGPLGSMNTGNWTQDQAADVAMQIAAGGGARSSVDGSPGVALWARPLAIVTAAYVTVAVLPQATDTCTVGAVPNATLDSSLYTVLSMVTSKLTIVTPAGGGGVASAVLPFANGDSFGMLYDPGTDVAQAMYRQVGTLAWVSVATKAAAQGRTPTGWLALLGSNDGVAVRLRNFGVETIPGADPTANQQNVHGRGAC